MGPLLDLLLHLIDVYSRSSSSNALNFLVPWQYNRIICDGFLVALMTSLHTILSICIGAQWCSHLCQERLSWHSFGIIPHFLTSFPFPT